MNEIQQPERRLVIESKPLRTTVGILGVLFPFVLAIGAKIRGCQEIQGSISYYYHTSMGDVFVGFLCAFAMFLFAYMGYNKWESWAGNFAGLCALGVAIVPTTFNEVEMCCTSNPWYTNQIIHMISAVSFFLILSYFSLCLFTKSKDRNLMTTRKKHRNTVYIVCGVVMLVCLASIAIYMLFLHESFPQLNRYKPIFWFESIALVAFGISWLTKGELILEDQ